MQSEDRGRTLVAGLRAHVRVDCERAAGRIRWVHAITVETHAQAAATVGFRTLWSTTRGGLVTGHDLDVLAAQEVAAATGLPLYLAEREVQVARTLVEVLPTTLGLLEVGRIDPGRAQTLAEGVTGLPPVVARKVEAAVLDGLPTASLDGGDEDLPGPWDGCSPRAFMNRVKKAVAAGRTETEEQVRDDVRARTGTSVWVHPENPALATLTVTGPTEQVAGIEASLDASVRGMGREELAGRTLGMAAVDALDDAVHGGPSATGTPSGGCVPRELALVMTADTFFGDGPAADAPGEVRGVGAPVPVSAPTARVLAEQAQTRAGKTTAGTCVLLTDEHGMLTRLVRVGRAPETGWTRTTLVEATQRAIAKPPRHHTDAYAPTVEIEDFVRARDPVCTFPGCGVPAARCDLDHTIPHPRGPTSVRNLSPRSRRCHRYKTAGLVRVRTRTNAAGLVVAHEWTTLLGTRQVVEVEPLPGFVSGEGTSDHT